MTRAVLIAALLMGDTLRPGIAVRDEGTAKGQATTVNCTGSGVTCSVSAGVWTLNGSGGGGGAPTDATYVTLTANASLSAEAVVPTCLGTDKLTFNGSALSCAADVNTPYTLPDATSLVTGGIRLTGDLGGTATSPTVVDDSHAHTSTTISGLDATNDFSSGTLPQTRGGTGAGALTCTAAQKLTSNGTAYSCATDIDTVYTLPAMTSTVLGGVKGTGAATACSGGQFALGFDAAGALTCGTPSGGGAPTTAQYWVGAADAGLSAEKDLSGFTGLVLNTAGTPSSKAANTCTNQFPRSDNASGVWTCATIASADLPAATTALGAVKHAANCSAGNHVNGIGAGGELSCSADSGGAPSFSGLTAGGVMYADSTTTIVSTGTGTSGRSALTSGGTGAPTWVQNAFGVTMTQDRSPSGTITTGQTTTDLTWPINANEAQAFTCNLTSTSTAASKLRYAVAGPASMTYVNCRTVTTTTALTTAVAGMLQGQWASTCTNCTPSVTASVLTSKLTDQLACTVVNGANAGSITIYFAASATAVTNTLHKGSGCVITGGG